MSDDLIALCPWCCKPWSPGHFCRIIPGPGMPPPTATIDIAIKLIGDPS